MNGKSTLVGILICLTLIINVYAVSDENSVLNKKFDMSNPFQPQDWDDDDKKDIIDESDIVLNYTVTMPEKRIGDSMRFDYKIFGEYYIENTSSEEWKRYTLTGGGQLREKVLSPESADDCFGVLHNALHTNVERRLSFTLIIDNNTSEDEFEISGTGEVFRDTFTELAEQTQIKMITDGRVDVDKIPQAEVPISLLGTVHSYPNPNDRREITLDERVYSEGQTLELGDNGSWTEEAEVEWLAQTYNWSVDSGAVIADYETLRVNVTSKWFDLLNFQWHAWIADEVPMPVQLYTKINSTFSWSDNEGYLIIEQNQTLQKDGYIEGTEDIPWEPEGSDAGFRQQRASTEIKTWDYIPEGGSLFSISTIEFPPEEAVQYARDHSQDLDDFLDEYRKEIVTDAEYNATLDITDTNGKAGEYTWNISFGAQRDEDESRGRDEDESRGIEKEYNIMIMKTITKTSTIPLEYEEEMEIYEEWGLKRGYADLTRDDLPEKGLTLFAAEKIIKEYPEAEPEFFDRTGDLEVEELAIHYDAYNSEASGMPGADLFGYISGIDIPQTGHAWTFQQSSVWNFGSTFAVAIDIDTGAMISIVEMSGTVMTGLFG